MADNVTTGSIEDPVVAANKRIVTADLSTATREAFWKVGAATLGDAFNLIAGRSERHKKIPKEALDEMKDVVGLFLGVYPKRGDNIYRFVADRAAARAKQVAAKQIAGLEIDLAGAQQDLEALKAENAGLNDRLAELEAQVRDAKEGHSICKEVIRDLKWRLVGAAALDLKGECPDVGPGELSELVVMNTVDKGNHWYSFRAMLSYGMPNMASPFCQPTELDLPNGLVEAFARHVCKSPDSPFKAGGQHEIRVRTDDGKVSTLDVHGLQLSFEKGKLTPRKTLTIKLVHHVVREEDVLAMISDAAANAEAGFGKAAG